MSWKTDIGADFTDALTEFGSTYSLARAAGGAAVAFSGVEGGGETGVDFGLAGSMDTAQLTIMALRTAFGTTLPVVGDTLTRTGSGADAGTFRVASVNALDGDLTVTLGLEAVTQ
jgi:hypothetical protein